MAAGISRIEQRNDVGMVEPRNKFDLAKKSVRPECGAQFWMKHLECDTAIVSKISGEINGRHAAAAELAVQVITRHKR